jgi:hypothetical protein
VGVSPLRASTVALARNLQTGSITPQFHVIFGNLSETVHYASSEPPPNWEEIIVFNSFRADIDEDGNIP